tara:strand:+ start:179 stop:790 length:612 start_codon:yes stop_codon:yes gene_type:complete
MTAFAIDYKKNTIRAFKSKRSALNIGNGLVVFTSVDELLENKNTTNQGIVAVYNNNTDVAVKRFSDTRTGAARLFKLAQDIHVESTPFDEAPKKTPQVAPLEGMTPLGITPKSAPFSRENMGMDVAKTDAKKPRGKFVGKCIKVLVDENPRRAGGHGHKMIEWLLAENKKLGGGIIEYSNYVAAGGRPQDLQWDLDRNWVEIV